MLTYATQKFVYNIGSRTPNVCPSLPEMSLPYFLIASITRNTSFKFRKKTSLMDEKEGRERGMAKFRNPSLVSDK